MTRKILQTEEEEEEEENDEEAEKEEDEEEERRRKLNKCEFTQQMSDGSPEGDFV